MERYRRQIILPEFGEEGQAKLKVARCLVLGVGGLGSVVATYLARMGFGELGLVDSDKLETSNLHRQILYSTDELGQDKALVAQQKLQAANPEVKIKPYALRLTKDNIDEIIQGYDLVVDCADNFETRFLANDACLRMKKPLIHGAIFQYEGQVMMIKPGEGPCLRCVFGKAPNVPQKELGVFPPAVGVIASIMAGEAVKLILGQGNSLAGKLLVYDALKLTCRLVD
ncbi:MAG: HesA/MoeB/ThiF family protein, partial [bacterium]